jgi:hypothetical protein
MVKRTDQFSETGAKGDTFAPPRSCRWVTNYAVPARREYLSSRTVTASSLIG